jgi:flagellar hook-associated protein 1
LNKLVKVSTTTNSDGSFNVFIGTGQQLVVGTQVTQMTAAPSSADPSRFAVGLKTAGGTQELPESLITGGSLGGLLSFRSTSLDSVANDLGRNAASLALTFNAQNALGQDLQGNIHGDTSFVDDFFTVPTPKVVANTLNPAGSPDVSVAYTAPSFNGNFYTDLTSSDYRLGYDGATLTLTRLSDNYSWSVASADPADLTAVMAADASGSQGFSLSSSATPLLAGSSYLIQPTRDAARNISINAAVAADPRLVAAAAPIRTQTGTSNTGSATISAGSVATGYSAASGLPATFTYTAGVPPQLSATADVTVTSGGVSTAYSAGASWNYVSGDSIVFNNGIGFSISGTPNNNDTFVVSRNSAGTSDGRNALALGQLQTQNTMSGKTASYESAYAQLVSDNGNKTREINVKSEAQSALLTQATDARDSLSGVNLDEEAADLLRYQQAYQASAKILEIGSKLFDTLLAINA